MTRIYDGPNADGTTWPKWWEEEDDPDDMGSICAVCLRDMRPSEQSGAMKGVDMDIDMEFGSCFCVCARCVRTIGARPSDPTVDSHDRAVIQRFSAVYRTLTQEIKNARRRSAEAWGIVGAVQSRWAHYGYHQ